MKNNLTELVFILDKSGSMTGMESDTIGGFNSLIEKQKKEEGEAFVTTVLFSNSDEIVHDRVNLKDIKKMTEDDYLPSGCTALLDSIGNSIEHIEKIHKYARKEDIPENVMFVITTDGLENASHKYTSSMIKEMIKGKENMGWTFLFLGANIDAVETASNIGIDMDCAVDFHCDETGTGACFRGISKAISKKRTCGSVSSDWKDEIVEDFESRK